ncbi:hypothetical protein M378DRAFT_49930, partial [Amanita muscaria Koide BX008]
NDNEYAPFLSKLDWELARWAKVHGPSSSALTQLLQIEGVVQTLALSYKNARELNNIIDHELPSCPSFKRLDLHVGGEQVSMYARDILQCIRALYGDPAFTRYLILRPERHYKLSGDQWSRVYHDMHTGNWWWEIQITLEASKPGATICPVIISSDRTQVTLFSSKTAYPVYMTIGNLPKAVRRKPSRHGQVLLAYLPTSKLTGVTNRECPKCNIPRSDVGDIQVQATARDLNAVHQALSKVNGDTREYINACKGAGIKPVYHPFWEPLPYIDIFQAITPDILHQLHQGVFKHLVAWLLQAYGSAEIDARVRRLIPNHHVHIFPNGISRLFRVTGKEHNFISRVILGVICDIRLPSGFNSSRLIRAVRALLDFMFLAQLQVITLHDLKYMESSLKSFHENKAIFVDLGIRDHFTIPKLHALVHYVTSIQLFGSTDNYNTQHTERLHIDYTKEAYRATNTRDEYPQMTAWLERREKVDRHEKYIKWQNNSVDDTDAPPSQMRPHLLTDRRIKMTRKPTIQVVSMDDLVLKYGATFFCGAFTRFVVLWRNPQINRTRLEREVLDVHIPFRTVSVYHRIRFEDAHTLEGFADTIHIQPQYKNTKGQLIPGRFDTALVKYGSEMQGGIHAFRVAQVRVVFSLGSAAIKHLFGNCELPPQHLAYVEWFTPFRASPEPDSKLYKIERSCQGNSRLASVIPVSHITQSIHLSPLPSGRVMPHEWNSNNILDNCRSFLVNVFTDTQTYQ